MKVSPRWRATRSRSTTTRPGLNLVTCLGPTQVCCFLSKNLFRIESGTLDCDWGSGQVNAFPFPITENPNALSRKKDPPRKSEVKTAQHGNAAKTKRRHRSSCSESGGRAFRHRLRRSSQTSLRLDDGRLLWKRPHRTTNGAAPRSEF